MSNRAEQSLLIAFTDLYGYSRHASRTPDAEVAELMDALYRRIDAAIAAAGGRVVKFIGDSSMMVFPEEAVDRGVLALLDLKDDVEQWLAREFGWKSTMVVKAHFGPAIAGGYGPDERFDCIGFAVNTAAMLDTRSFALSAQAFRKLAPDTRKRFKKHTPPVTYIRTEDRHPR